MTYLGLGWSRGTRTSECGSLVLEDSNDLSLSEEVQPTLFQESPVPYHLAILQYYSPFFSNLFR